MTPKNPEISDSVTAQALNAAGDAETARDVDALETAQRKASERDGPLRRSLVERLIFGPLPPVEELRAGACEAQRAEENRTGEPIVERALASLVRGEAFTADGKLSATLRLAVAAEKAYGYTVPVAFGGLGGSYIEFARTEESLAANGLGALAVELSGQLTIGASSLLGYGSEEQKRTFLPLIAEGELVSFALTEVKVGVNARKVRAYVEPDASGEGFRLHADGDRNKLWITSATHGALAAIVARIGRNGDRIGLFVLRLPERDTVAADGLDYEFSCKPSDTAGFRANINSLIHFRNFPVPALAQIQADGVEVIFYCLRRGRCMLAAMAAGFQRMMATDAAHYARARIAIGGAVIKHELPRQGLARMLGGALQARALSHLSLQQDEDGVDLAGLRDITKSAAADAALASLVACERVLGGRAFDLGSRVSAVRHDMHSFGVVEGENDLIRMGMVKDVTSRFTRDYVAGLLGVLQSINVGADGQPLAPAQRLLRIEPATLWHQPRKLIAFASRLLTRAAFWRLAGWVVRNVAVDMLRLFVRPIPVAWLPRFQGLPPALRQPAREAERRLRGLRWVWLGMNAYFQLELTRAQIPLQRLGKHIDQLISVLAICHHAATLDASQQAIAACHCEQLLAEVRERPLLRGLAQMDRLRSLVAAVGDDIEQDRCSLIADLQPQPWAHPWDAEQP